jgi:uncharacterized membrane protein YphA (DoxX/SURF4 family)
VALERTFGTAKMKTRILQILNWGCRVVLAAMFFYTGYIKIEAPLQFAVTIAGYELFPEALIPFFAKWFPWAEIVLGVFLLIGWKMRYVAAATTALLLFFTVILSITYFRGIDANCGCFDFTSKISPMTILRDSIILIPAIYLLFEHRLYKHLRPAKSEEPGNLEQSPGNAETDAS